MTGGRETLSRPLARHGSGAALFLLGTGSRRIGELTGGSVHRGEQFRSLSFELEARVLMRPIARNRGNPLHEVED